MTTPKSILREFAVLTEGQLRQTLDHAEAERLLQLMAEYPELADILDDNIKMDGLLRDAVEEQGEIVQVLSGGRAATVYRNQFVRYGKYIFSTAMALLLLVITGMMVVSVAPYWQESSVSPDPTLATIMDTRNCQWRQTTFSTEKGARLAAGRLELLTGIATIKFDCGAVVSLESSSTLEIIDPKRCVLTDGRCVVTAEPESAKGFVVETPFVTVTDEGTKFSLNVGRESADVSVLKGSVKTWCPENGTNTRLIKNESASYGSPVTWDAVPRNGESLAHVIQLSTASPGGKEAWVLVDPNINMHVRRVAYYPWCDRFLLLKRGGYPAENQRPNADRRVIFGIDLSPLRDKKIDEVQLKLSLGNTGMGFMSFVPDSRFVVYGLRDDQQDNWDEATMTWETMPGNNSDFEMDSSVYTPIGEFMMPQGVAEKTIILSGDALKEFIENDENDFVTFVVEDKTEAAVGDSYVFGIAGRGHPKQSPPTLIFKCLGKKSK
ncbi:MAG: FecR domain-containing protein [Planctomycetia bacterium]|nr:FecR domain-containing protein [Planctomycetia bacterium]